MRKAFVIDTNVILYDPQAVFKFGENDLVVPITVLEEVDRFKREMSENGRHARQFSRLLDKLRKEGELSKGVQLKTGTKLMVELGTRFVLPEELHPDKADNRILAVAMSVQRDDPKRTVVFVTKDVNLRIKADALGISAEDYEPEQVDAEQIFNGVQTLECDRESIDIFFKTKKLAIDARLSANEYVCLKDPAQAQHSALARYDLTQKALVPLIKPPEGIWGIFAKNAEQSFAIDALLNDDIKLVSLAGKAGTGKTLLAIAAGLCKTMDEGVYHRLLVSRPVFPLGKDIGFLPGTVEEKLNPWMQPIFDNIDFLFGATGAKGRRGAGKGCQELINQGLLQIEPLTYIRGRSIPQQYMIIDEAQNLTPHEIKTIVTRAGDETKIVLTGDSFQIDNPYVDALSNGLVHVIERFKQETISAHVTLLKGERSLLSELASNLL